MMKKELDYMNIPEEKFRLANADEYIRDEKLDTKPIGYLHDAFNRFSKNKASVAAGIIIGILVLYAIVGPFMVKQSYVNSYETDTSIINYKELRPKLACFEGTGFWDGSKIVEVSETTYNMYLAKEQESGHNVVEEVLDTITIKDDFGRQSTVYRLRIDTYYGIKTMMQTLTTAQYKELQDWQDEHGIQVILPQVAGDVVTSLPDVWYESDAKGKPIFDADGAFQYNYLTSGSDDYYSVMRLEADPYNQGDEAGCWRYAKRTGKAETGYNYVVRVDPYNYFIYRHGFEPCFAFGTDSRGFDIFSRLASGARLSFLLAIFVSAINLTIGAFYGAIEGYYGGATDMVMERISDILSGVPFMVVTVLFKLHLASKVGVMGSLLFAFVLTGWIGMASSVRMQFYRFKNQEYVLSARTLGAKDFRIMFKHIFPNSLGTLITGCVLVIPGVIFSETSLSYLGIINLSSRTTSSIGSMLAQGQAVMTTSPHVVLFPAIFIGLLEISFNLFGNGLRDAFNPSLRGSED
ncbi:MAG: ABC transporter permease [Lachnospiraceae bacterium]|nr:ABC transporter permease [Lachnospiraceae bacterium]